MLVLRCHPQEGETQKAEIVVVSRMAGEAKCPHFESSFCNLLIAILKILGMQLFLQ